MRTTGIATLVTTSFALLASSCAVDGGTQAAQAEVAHADARAAFAKRGPTLTLDEQAKLADPTALQLLEERSQELAKTRKRVDELEAELQQRARELDEVKDDARSRSEEKEQLAGLLREATENERAATEKAISAEIARLKFEQELLRMKLANVVRETP